MQSGARAVADPDKGSGPRVEHEREILRAHHRRKSDIDFVLTGNLTGNRRGKLRLFLVVHEHRGAALVGELGLGAIGSGSAFQNNRQTPLQEIAHLRRETASGPAQLYRLRDDVVGVAGTEHTDRYDRRFERVDVTRDDRLKRVYDLRADE